MSRITCGIISLLCAVVIAGCNGGGSSTPSGTGSNGSDTSGSGTKTTTSSGKKPKFAFITNCEASFWKIAEKGVNAAAKEFDVEAIYREPKTAQAVEQKEIIQDMLTNGIDGIAITPISPENQTDILNEAADNCILICHDSDAPASKRKVFIGVDNYKAGRECGKLVKQSMPNGGSIMVFVGRMEQLNARQRRQGMIDEIFDRSFDPTRFDEPGKVIKEGDKYEVLDTLTDLDDRAKALALCQDAIIKYPNLGCMVGLFAYNPPICLKAVKDSGNIGKIKIVGFDEDDATLQAVVDGEIFGTVVQDPYNYGYQSIKVLNELKKGNASIIPESKVIEVPAKVVTKENVEEFWKNLKELVK